MPDFAARLAAAGVKGPRLREFAERLAGAPIARSTIPRWQKGERQPDPWALALLAVIADPTLIEELRK
jgi:DNA-binding transcriptional regulator YiaG